MTKYESILALSQAVEALAHVGEYAEDEATCGPSERPETPREFAARYTGDAVEALLTLTDECEGAERLHAQVTTNEASRADDRLQSLVTLGRAAA